MVSINTLPEKFERRVINDPTLDRFIWEKHNFSTEYVEPFDVAKSQENQTLVTKQFFLPQRQFVLEFRTMFYIPDSEDIYNVNSSDLSLSTLIKFYEKHGTHGKFIYTHPVYGDCICRFKEPLVIPKKNISGMGSVDSFKVTLMEDISRDHFIYKDEQHFDDINFDFEYGLVEIKYPTTSNNIALGNNYAMVFREYGKPLRTFSITLPTLLYREIKGELHFNSISGINLLLLEMFYLNKRLSKKFIFKHNGEDIPVKFNKPLIIPTIKGNTGFTSEISIELREAPYEQLDSTNLGF